MKITIQGKEIKLFEHDCLLNGETKGKEVQPFVDISVHLTNQCNAACVFCCNEGKEEVLFDQV